ncbi:unnamed protein product [Ectocarpus sp. 12 AP-2014]
MDAAREAARNGPKPRQRHPCPENWLPHNLYCWSLLGPLSSNPISDLCIGGTGSSSASPVAPSTGEAGGKASALGSPAALTAVGSNGEHSRREMAHMKREKRKADRKAETTTKFEEKMGESSKHMEQLVGVLSQVVGSNKGSEISATAKAQADLLQQLETMADEDQDTNQRDTFRQKRREVLTGALAQLSGPTSEVPTGGKRSAPGVRSSSECVDLARGSSNAAGHRSSTGSSVAGSSTDSTLGCIDLARGSSDAADHGFSTGSSVAGPSKGSALGGGSAGVVDMDATDGVVPRGNHRCMHGMPARRRCVSRGANKGQYYLGCAMDDLVQRCDYHQPLNDASAGNTRASVGISGVDTSGGTVVCSDHGQPCELRVSRTPSLAAKGVKFWYCAIEDKANRCNFVRSGPDNGPGGTDNPTYLDVRAAEKDLDLHLGEDEDSADDGNGGTIDVGGSDGDDDCALDAFNRSPSPDAGAEHTVRPKTAVEMSIYISGSSPFPGAGAAHNGREDRGVETSNGVLDSSPSPDAGAEHNVRKRGIDTSNTFASRLVRPCTATDQPVAESEDECSFDMHTPTAGAFTSRELFNETRPSLASLQMRNVHPTVGSGGFVSPGTQSKITDHGRRFPRGPYVSETAYSGSGGATWPVGASSNNTGVPQDGGGGVTAGAPLPGFSHFRDAGVSGRHSQKTGNRPRDISSNVQTEWV